MKFAQMTSLLKCLLLLPTLLLFSCGKEDPNHAELTMQPTQGTGGSSISGVISFPGDTPQGLPVMLAVFKVGGWGETRIGGHAGVSDRMTYEIQNLEAGKYFLGATIMKDDFNHSLYTGYYNGTVEKPIFFPNQGKMIELEEDSLEDADFGLGSP